MHGRLSLAESSRDRGFRKPGHAEKPIRRKELGENQL